MGSAFTRVHSRIYNATRFSRGNRVVTITARGQLYPSIEQIDRSVGHSLARSLDERGRDPQNSMEGGGIEVVIFRLGPITRRLAIFSNEEGGRKDSPLNSK